MTRSLASARRIREVLTEQPDLANAAEPVDTVPNGQIDFEGVSFKYNAAAQKSALSDITLHIPAGATVGIIGGTGAAKTTLVQLIPRLYDATEGTVKVGGRDVRDYDLTALRDAVGIVLQKNLLFSGTIRDNLKWGNPDAAEEQLWAACRAAHADEFLDRMPDGLDTDLGQGGINVSGGQKQRLCIARTLLKHPKVLIFDDSTSAVDTATESGIRRALAELTDVTKLKLYPLTAWDEVSFARRMARVLALILPDVGDLAAAEALATNCVTVFCAVRGAIDEVRTPEDLLYRLTLDEIAQLAERYARLRDGWCEREGEDSHAPDA